MSIRDKISSPMRSNAPERQNSPARTGTASAGVILVMHFRSLLEFEAVVSRKAVCGSVVGIRGHGGEIWNSAEVEILLDVPW